MGPDDASVVRNLPDPSYTPAPLGAHHVPDGRPPQPGGVVEVGCCYSGLKSPSQIARDVGDYVHVAPPAPDARPAPLVGEVPIGSNEPGVRSPSQVSRESAS